MLLHASMYRLYVSNFVLAILDFYRNSKFERNFGGLFCAIHFRHEIVSKDFGNALEECYVNGFAFEDVVNVLPVAVQPARELAYAQACNRQMFFYPFASVYVHFSVF